MLQGVSAIALTSENLMELCTYYTHNPGDNISIVDYDRIVDTVIGCMGMISKMIL